MAETIGWIVFAVVQVIVLVGGGFLLFGPRPTRPYSWIVLIAIGTLLLAVNVAWYASGGLDGPAGSYMRGGMQGFWFSTVTFVEVIVLGLLSGLRHWRG